MSINRYHKIVTVVALFSSVLMCSFSAAAQSSPQQSTSQKGTIQITDLRNSSQTQEYQLPQGLRVTELLDRLVADPRAVDWQRSRLGSQSLQEQLQAKQQQLGGELYQLKQWGLDDGNPQLTHNASALIDLVSRSSFQASYYLGIPYYEQRAGRADNPRLAEPHTKKSRLSLTLYPADNAAQAAVIGLVKQPLLVSAGQTLGQVLEQTELRDGAEGRIAWLLRANGDVAEVPIAYFNRGQPAHCFYHSRTRPLIPLSEDSAKTCWPSQTLAAGDQVFIGLRERPQLNRRLVDLLKFRMMP